jgi:hypothetical protein
MNRLFVLPFLLILSCSRSHTLGTQEHSFGKKAKHIVWIQVDGLEEEHIALAKFASDSIKETTPLEQMACTGAMWDYNLFELRPEPIEGFMSQVLGSQKIKGDCTDLDRLAVWNYYEAAGYQLGIIEGSEVKEQSLLRYGKCDSSQPLFKSGFFWSQSTSSDKKNSFHYQEKLSLDKPGVFFDKSCQKENCFVSLKNNVEKIWPTMTKNFSKTFFVVRQSAFRKHLLRKDILKARESLQEVMKIINYFLPKARKGEVSLVVTSASSRRFEFPRSGKYWSKYEKKGTKVIYRRSGLLSRAWSSGPGAENYCGTYEASDILRRFIWAPSKDVFYFSF